MYVQLWILLLLLCVYADDSDYAKFVAMRIERIGLLVHVSVLRANVDIEDEVAEAMNRGCAFALCLSVIGFQSSTTLYILHGDPEGGT